MSQLAAYAVRTSLPSSGLKSIIGEVVVEHAWIRNRDEKQKSTFKLPCGNKPKLTLIIVIFLSPRCYYTSWMAR